MMTRQRLARVGDFRPGAAFQLSLPLHQQGNTP